MKKVTDPTRKDYIQSIIYILLYVIAISLGAYFLMVEYWYIWLVIVIVGLVLLVNWHKVKTAYICPNCGHTYKISFLTDFFAPHGIDRDGGWLLLRCPNCHERRKTKIRRQLD